MAAGAVLSAPARTERESACMGQRLGRKRGWGGTEAVEGAEEGCRQGAEVAGKQAQAGSKLLDLPLPPASLLPAPLQWWEG